MMENIIESKNTVSKAVDAVNYIMESYEEKSKGKRVKDSL